MDKKTKQKDLKNEIWNKFCEKLEKLFKGKFCVYPSQEDIAEINSSDYPAEKLEENYYSLVEPTIWKLNASGDKIEFNSKKAKTTGVSKYLNKKTKSFIKKNSSELSSKDIGEWDVNDNELVYSISYPKLLESGLNKIEEKLVDLLKNNNGENKKSSTKKKRILSTATDLYEGLKNLESHAEILKASIGDSKEDNDYIIERERHRNILWKILGKLGALGKDNYQEISEDEENGSKEFNLKSLFDRSKAYRKMLKVYMDDNPENQIESLKQSLVRRSLRILIMLKKWVEFYTKKPTANNARGKLNKMLANEINRFLKFSNSKKQQKTYTDLKGKDITPTTLVENIGNIQKFLRDWSKIKLSKRYIHNIKNIKIKDVANKLYGMAKVLGSGLSKVTLKT